MKKFPEAPDKNEFYDKKKPSLFEGFHLHVDRHENKYDILMACLVLTGAMMLVFAFL